MLKRNGKWIFLIVIFVTVLIICFMYYYNLYYVKDKIVISYNLLIPDYEPKDIVIKDKEHLKLFEDMISDGQEQYREYNLQENIAGKKAGSFISFKKSSEDSTVDYVLRGTDLYVSVYKNGETFISEFIFYKIPDKYYDKWVEYCENH